MTASRMTGEGGARRRPHNTVHAEVAAAEIATRRAGRHLLLLFDFDGTLAPFAARPDGVRLPQEVASCLHALAASRATTVGVISGRRLADLERLVELSADSYLAGSHGMEIRTAGETFVHPDAAAARGTVRSVAAALEPALADCPGVFIENKGFAIALHFREAAAGVRAAAIARFTNVAQVDLDAGRLRLLPGSCVLELLPRTPWHKGSALEWIRERVVRAHGPTFTVYAGDDVTDVDALHAVGADGIGIAASERAIGAEFSVDGPEDVARLLHSLRRRHDLTQCDLTAGIRDPGRPE